MISNDKLKEIDIKNCMCYYFDDIIKIEDFDLDNILIDKTFLQESELTHITLYQLKKYRLFIML